MNKCSYVIIKEAIFMPTNRYTFTGIDCANCAAKIEAKFNALPEVEEATITFATRQIRVTAADPDSLLPKLQAIARTVESEATFTPGDRTESHHHEHTCACDHHSHEHGCNCGHDHHEHHEHDHNHEHDHEDNHGGLFPILLGAGLFVLGLILEYFALDLPAKAIFVVSWLILGREVLTSAVKNLAKGHILDENFLMSIATLGAFVINEFPEAVGVMLFYRVGEYFEHRAVERSRSQIMDAVDLRPEEVNRVSGDEIQTIPAADAKVGDLLLVRPGDRIPLDGIVISGTGPIDTAPITGEPVPVYAAPGDALLSGCINLSAQLTLRVDKPLSESMVTRILNSVENAAASKPKIDRFITRFARIYTPLVVTAAALIAIVPSVITGDWSNWVYTALSFLVMSCPCALVLSVPLAFFSGIGAGSRRGILFKGGVSMEAMAGVKAVVLDKTGTLTRGEFRVQEIAGNEEMLRLCAAAEQRSTHPIARSIVARAGEMDLPTPENPEEIAGQGICATIEGKAVLCGNARLMREHNIPFEEVSDAASTVVYVAADGVFLGHLLISDTIKDGAAEAVAQLKRRGIATAMLTGDGEATARAVAKTTGVEEVHAKLLPHQKLEQLQRIRAEKGAAMFVGDGINDAPVLAGADVGAAMGSGADAAIEAADVVFMTSAPEAIPEALSIAARTKAIAWQNVTFALAIKAVVMALGLLGYASMWLAVFADSGVAMLCVLNSIRLLYKK